MTNVRRTAAFTAAQRCARSATKRDLKQAKAELAKLSKRIARAEAKGDEGRATALRRRLLRSNSCKLACLAEQNRRVKRERKIEFHDLIPEARNLNLTRGTQEPVEVWAKRKANGTLRPITSCGPRLRAMHQLLRIAIGRWVRKRLHPNQFALQGGRDVAVRTVIDKIEKGDVQYACELDISEFYSSIDIRWLKAVLPLPEVLIDRTIATTRWNFEPKFNANALKLLRQCRTGIAQGSGLSPLLAELVVAQVLETVPSRAGLVNYADNILVLARTREELDQQVSTVARAFSAHSSGSFSLTQTRRRITDGFTFLGYDIRKRKRSNSAIILPTAKNHFSLVARVWEAAIRQENGRRSPLGRANAWCRGFQLCPEFYHEVTARSFARYASSPTGLRSSDALNCWRRFRRATRAFDPPHTLLL